MITQKMFRDQVPEDHGRTRGARYSATSNARANAINANARANALLATPHAREHTRPDGANGRDDQH